MATKNSSNKKLYLMFLMPRERVMGGYHDLAGHGEDLAQLKTLGVQWVSKNKRQPQLGHIAVFNDDMSTRIVSKLVLENCEEGQGLAYWGGSARYAWEDAEEQIRENADESS